MHRFHFLWFLGAQSFQDPYVTTFNLCASEGRLQADCRHMGGVEKVYPKLAMSGANI